MRRLALAVLLAGALGAGTAFAYSDPSEVLPNPAEEARAEAIGRQLRCLVCQNESIEQSDAGLARDLRAIIRRKVAKGESDKVIIGWMVARYGNFIRLDPPFDAMTFALWGAPFIALGIGAGVVVLARRRGPTPAPAPLDPDEQARLSRLLEP
ncbi:MAG: cytochrome c-type biogenesis protein CcmH [Rhodospirillales bacterium]|nr:cytochrome c-type biogenesis protein CcmH [Rhodospirillales bacterium]